MRTYRELLESLKTLNEEQLDQDVTIMDGDEEFHGVRLKLEVAPEDDVLDQGHAFLSLETHYLEGKD